MAKKFDSSLMIALRDKCLSGLFLSDFYGNILHWNSLYINYLYLAAYVSKNKIHSLIPATEVPPG